MRFDEPPGASNSFGVLGVGAAPGGIKRTVGRVGKRREDWPERLNALVEERRRTAFAWGTHDCILFAADAVAAMTGRDPAAAWRGAYADAEGAARIIRLAARRARRASHMGEGGCAARGGIEEVLRAALGAPIMPAFAQRGDVVLVETPAGPAAGICLGAACVFAAPRGLSYLPLRRAVLAFRVD